MDGRNIYENISVIVDRIFNVYLRRPSRQEPFFAQYCNGTAVTCPGLSQWGTVTLANQGYNPLQILRYYYPNDVALVTSNIFEELSESYPGTALKEGSQGRDVQTMQAYLNRIRQNYPLIPRIANPNGVFGADTTAAVKTFQQTFDLSPDGIIGKATWYKISYYYAAVKKLSELNSEGEYLAVGQTPPTVVLRQGSTGTYVTRLQYMLSLIGSFYPEIPETSQDGVFGSGTKAAVESFQRLFGLTADGIVGPGTWNKLYDVYWGIEDNITIPPGVTPPVTPPEENDPQYPGSPLRYGARGDNVLLMQRYLNSIAGVYSAIPKITADGIFGWNTYNAVLAFQRQFGLSPDGVIGPVTWKRIVQEYNRIGESGAGSGAGSGSGSGSGSGNQAYPGSLLKQGAQGSSVQLMQNYLNALSATYPSIPKLVEDGIFGANTKRAVTEFQRLSGLSQDGIIGPVTWQAIVNEYNRLYGNRAMVQSMSRMILSKMFLGF